MMSQREAHKELTVFSGFSSYYVLGGLLGSLGGLLRVFWGSFGGLLGVFWEVSTYTPMMVLTVCTTSIQIHS